MEIEITSAGSQKPDTSAEQRQKPRRFLNWKFALIAVVGCLILIGCLATHGLAHATAPAEDLITVPVAKIMRENLVRNRTFEAEFRPYQAIDLHANVAGFVQSIKVDIGDQVQAGDVLAVLSIPELKEDTDRAAAVELGNEQKVIEAAATYEDANLTSTRLSTIDQEKPHLIAKQDLDTALAKTRAAKAALEAAKEDVEVSKAEIAKLKTISGYCTITAPFSGVITKRYADQGALVQGGVDPSGAALPLVRLSQNDRLRLDFPISVSCVQYIEVGHPVKIKILGTRKIIPGKISRFTRDVDMATRTMEAEVDVTNTDLSLTPGIYAEVSLNLEHRENVLAIPTEALSSIKSPTALILNSENRLEERPLTLGLAADDEFEVVSGLNENDLVMVGSRAKVQTGQKVDPKLMETAGTP